jgi:hypothetical protein
MRAAKSKSLVKMTGYTNWTQDPGCQPPGVSVRRAILRGEDELIFDFDHDGWSYQVALRRVSGSRFQGTFDAVLGGRHEPIQAECTFYSNGEGGCLIGRWFEDGKELVWWAEFRKVEHFADEVIVHGAN